MSTRKKNSTAKALKALLNMDTNTPSGADAPPEPRREAVTSERLTELLEGIVPGPWTTIEALGRGVRYIGPVAGLREYKPPPYPREALPPTHRFVSEIATVEMDKWSKANAELLALSPDLAREVLALRSAVGELAGALRELHEGSNCLDVPAPFDAVFPFDSDTQSDELKEARERAAAILAKHTNKA